MKRLPLQWKAQLAWCQRALRIVHTYLGCCACAVAITVTVVGRSPAVLSCSAHLSFRGCKDMDTRCY